MSMSRRPIQAALSSFVIGLVLTGFVRSADPLEDAKQRREIAAQRVEADVRAAVRDVNQLARTSTAKALAKLRDLLELIDDDTALTPERREALKAMAKARMRELETGAGKRTTRTLEEADRSASAAQRRADEDRRAAESQRLARGLQDVQALRAAGRTADANQMQADLARRFPDSPAAAAARIIGGRADNVADARRLRGDVASGFQGTLNEVDKSAVPEAGDYVLPADWKTRVAKRTDAPKLTEQEKATLKALSEPIKTEFKDMPFSGVIDYLQNLTGTTIVADKKTLDAVNATYDTPITAQFKRASFRTVLKKILADVNLTYIIKEGAIKVVTPEEARNTMIVRAYYIGDLAGIVDVRISPLLRELQMQAAIAQIVDSIQGSIDPNSWQGRGRQDGGTITYDPITMSLIIKQTAEVHYQLSGFGR